MRSPIEITPLELATRFVGIKEKVGPGAHNPWILAWNSLIDGGVSDDETPWCSTFCHGICWTLGLPGNPNRRARSWLLVGRPVELKDARPGFTVVIFKRGTGSQPGPEVIAAPGHVAWLAQVGRDTVTVVGGNQSNAVTVATFPRSSVLGVREL